MITQSGQNKTGGRFIVFEGIDGCGKTTQLHLLHDWLQAKMFPQTPDGFPMVMTQEPGATALGRTLRQILLAPNHRDEGVDATAELLLYAADRAQHVQKVLKPKLAEGCWILCDRHVDSTVAYQGFGRGIDRALIEQINKIATDGLVSDLTLWLDLSVEVSRSRRWGRGSGDRIEQLDLAFHRRVQQGFESLAQEHPQRIVRIDASGSEAEVALRIQQTVGDWLRTHAIEEL